jgi:flagellar hook-associated protein 3 FlgL
VAGSLSNHAGYGQRLTDYLKKRVKTMMRITNSMMTQSVIRNINDNMGRLSDAQEETSTGVKIQEASDDPVAATKTLQYRSVVATIDQYKSNATDATSWMKVTSSTMDSLTDAVQQIRDLTAQAAGGILDDTELDAISAQVTEIKSSIVELMNTQYAGRYIFGGYATDEAPYASATTTVTDSTTGDTTDLEQTTFKGDYLGLYDVVSSSVDSTGLVNAYNAYASTTSGSTTTSNIYTSTGAQAIKYNTGYSSQTAVNVEGQDVTGSGNNNLFDTIDKLLLGLNGETSYQSVTVDSTTGLATGTTTTTFTIDGLLDEIDANLTAISTQTSSLGARMNYVETCTSRLASDYTTYTGLLSSNIDSDLSVATTEYATAQTIYDASLSVGAKVITKTLVDYLT